MIDNYNSLCIKCFRPYADDEIGICDSCIEIIKTNKIKKWNDHMEHLQKLIEEINNDNRD